MSSPPRGRRRRFLLTSTLALIAGLAAAQDAPKPPKPGAVERWSLGEVRGHRTMLQGYTPTSPRPLGGHPLLILIPDRKQSAKKILAKWPLEVFSRKGFVLAVPALRSADYKAENTGDLQAVVDATLAKARELWSVDPRKVFLLGLGSGSPGALACGQGESSAFAALAAVLPESEWNPAEETIDPWGPPTLVLTGGERGRRSPLVAALDDADRAVLHAFDPALELESVTDHTQRLLEWCLDRAREQEQESRAEAEGDASTGSTAEIPDIRDRMTAASGSENAIVVIPGRFDEVEQVLELLRIPHLVLSWREFGDHDLAETRLVLINCSPGAAYQVARKKASANLKRFVESGGYVFTTDWAVRYPLSDVFGGHVGRIELNNEDEMLPVRLAPGAGNHPLLQNVFPYDHPDPQWQLDAKSWLLKIVKPKEATVLLTSPEMGRRYQNDVVGALLQVGQRGGCILNVVSHFSHQGEGGATTPMYQLIVNFINEAKFGVRQRKRR